MSSTSQKKSLLDEHEQARQAVELIRLGARMQVLETETDISRSKLLRLYKEVRGMSPPKGMLPFSTDWFITWKPNIHASLFYNFYNRLITDVGLERIDALIYAYKMYLEQAGASPGEDPVLALTRAWTLVRFMESEQLEMIQCTTCSGHYVTHAHTPAHGYECGICAPPPRAGKGSRPRKTSADAREKLRKQSA